MRAHLLRPPLQNTVGYLESYVHGGTTTMLSAGEVHIPGQPNDVAGVKALAVAAHKCYENYRPGGMRVHAARDALHDHPHGGSQRP